MKLAIAISTRIPIRLLDSLGDPVIGILPSDISNGTLGRATVVRGDGSEIDLPLVNGSTWFEIDSVATPGLYHILLTSPHVSIPGALEVEVEPAIPIVFVATLFTGYVDNTDNNPFPADLVVSPPAQIVESFAFPFRYTPSGDIVRTQDEQAIENNMRSSVMIQKFSIPLRSKIGSSIPTFPFDPKDDALRELLIDEAINSIAVGEPRVVVDESGRFVDDPESNEVFLVMPYRLRQTDKGWRNLRLAQPDFTTSG